MVLPLPELHTPVLGKFFSQKLVSAATNNASDGQRHLLICPDSRRLQADAKLPTKPTLSYCYDWTHDTQSLALQYLQSYATMASKTTCTSHRTSKSGHRRVCKDESMPDAKRGERQIEWNGRGVEVVIAESTSATQRSLHRVVRSDCATAQRLTEGVAGQAT